MDPTSCGASHGYEPVALMPRAGWLMDWLYPGQHLAVAVAHGHELAASGAASGYLLLLLAFPLVGLGAGRLGRNVHRRSAWRAGVRRQPSGSRAVAGPAGWRPVRRGGKGRGQAGAQRARPRGGPHAGARGGAALTPAGRAGLMSDSRQSLTSDSRQY